MSQPVAIVTGATSGLGYATARLFCSKGAVTYLVGRSTEKVERACAEFGPNARALPFDLTDLADIPAMVRRVAEKEGRLDILVNNAGINMKKPFEEVTDEEFASILLTNVQSVFALSREAVKVMRQAGSGNIVNISSMAAQYGIPKVIAYTASKTAIEGMTRAMAVELGEYGIRVNCVAPGFIRTPMSAKALDNDPARKNKVLSRTPLGQLGQPDDIAEAVWHLASPASAYVTGVVLPVDGGNCIGF